MTFNFRKCGCLLFTIILFSACQKYEEGPKISLRSKKKRLVNKWIDDEQLVTIVNIEEGTSRVLDEDRNFKLHIRKDGTFSSNFIEDGNWSFEGDTHLNLNHFYGNENIYPNPIKFNILKLKNKELHVNCDHFLEYKGEIWQLDLHMISKN